MCVCAVCITSMSDGVLLAYIIIVNFGVVIKCVHTCTPHDIISYLLLIIYLILFLENVVEWNSLVSDDVTSFVLPMLPTECMCVCVCVC